MVVCDHLGTPKELIGQDGRLAWSAAHSAWGRVVETEGRGGLESPFQLLGQYHDAETGLCYTRFRYFDAHHGRWLSPDPLGFLGGANLLAFDGAPTTVVDPLGLACRPPPDQYMVALLRALRQRGTPEALATAKMIASGRVRVRFMPTDPHRQGAAGRAPWGSSEIELYLDQLHSANSAAGLAAHEVKHVIQGITPATYRKTHEAEAYQWQRAADSHFPWSDADVWNMLNTNPAYSNVPA